MKVYFVFISLIFSQVFADELTFSSQNSPDSIIELTSSEQEVLTKIGLDDQIDSIKQGSEEAIESLRSRAKDEVTSFESSLRSKADNAKDNIDQSIDELEARARQVKQDINDMVRKELNEVKQDVTTMARGYGLSTASLIMTGILAPRVLMTCRSKPSAVIYVGTAAIYITRELLNTGKFRASELSEIERISKLRIDRQKTYNQNIDAVKYAVDTQVDHLNSYSNILREGFESIRDKAKNARMASYGFGLASATAAAETFMGSGTCGEVPSEEELLSANYRQYLDETRSRIQSASSVTEAFYSYYEWESKLFGLEMAESYSFDEKKILSQFKNQKHALEFIKQSILASLEFVSDVFVSRAQANYSDQVEFTREEIFTADSKAYDLAADADKIGAILLGGSFELLMYAFVPGYHKFLTKVAASGPSRSIAFGGHALLAHLTANDLEEASENFLERVDKVDEIIDRIHRATGSALDTIRLSDAMARRIENFARRNGINFPKPLDQMSLEEIDRFLSSEVRKLKGQAKEEGQEILQELRSLKSAQLNHMTDEITPWFVRISVFIRDQFLTPELFASEQLTQNFDLNKLTCIGVRECRAPVFPLMPPGEFEELNPRIKEFSEYASSVFSGQEKRRQEGESLLSENQSKTLELRGQIYDYLNQQAQRPYDFQELIESSHREYQRDFERAVNSLDPNDQQLLFSNTGAQSISDQSLDRLESQKTVEASSGGGLSKSEILVLKSLVERIHKLGTTTRTETRRESDESYEDVGRFLHPVHLSLFDIIHRRYQIKMRNNEL